MIAHCPNSLYFNFQHPALQLAPVDQWYQPPPANTSAMFVTVLVYTNV